MTNLWEENLEGLDVAQVHWSTSTILTIFFAASLISALFFGLGFTFGHGGTAQPAADAESTAALTAPLQASGLKSDSEPMQHAALAGSAKPAAAHLALAQDSSVQTVSRPVPVAQTATIPATHESVANPIASTVATVAGNQQAVPPMPGRCMVQVGAIGDRKDALMLVSKLRKQGFQAAIYPGKRDKFLHVQLGPFSSKEQAQAMRHQVIAHGYHALLKPVS